MFPIIILVRPEHPGNIGSVARAMLNTGLQELRIVNPQCEVTDEFGIKMAMRGRHLLEGAKIFPELSEAVGDLDLVIATSRRMGVKRANGLDLGEFGEESQGYPQGHRVGILFGNEVTGLENPEIALGQKILTIPTHPDEPSLNLAQAVLLVAHEIFRTRHPGSAPNLESTETDVAKIEDFENMVADLRSLLNESGFLDQQNPDHLMQLLRNLFNRARLSDKEVRIFRGICRQLRWWKEN